MITKAKVAIGLLFLSGIGLGVGGIFYPPLILGSGLCFMSSVFTCVCHMRSLPAHEEVNPQEEYQVPEEAADSLSNAANGNIERQLIFSYRYAPDYSVAVDVTGLSADLAYDQVNRVIGNDATEHRRRMDLR